MGARFTFVLFGARASSESVSCDGLVEGAGLHLSHWEKNRTPPAMKADTSTESALRFAAGARGELEGRPVANNHFDADGVLSVFALLDPDVALAHRELMIAAAEAGDFDEWPADERGLMLEASIRALARGHEDLEAYQTVLPELAELLRHLDDRGELYRDELDALHAAEARARAGAVHVDRIGRTSLVVHREGEPEAPGPLIHRLVDRASTRWLLAFDEGAGLWSYRYERPRHAWADTVDRPRIAAPSKNAVAQGLGEGWALKDAGMTGLLRTKHPIAMSPEEVVAALHAHDPDAR